MKKITLLLMVMFFFAFGKSYGQWTENFESGIPSNWGKFTLLNGVTGTVPAWVNSTGTTCQGATGAYVSNAQIGQGNTSQAWLVTPLVSIPPNAELLFQGVQTFPAQNGSIYELRVSTTSQTDVSSFTLVKTWTENEMNPGNQLACANQTVNLSAYGNQSLYIAFIKKDTQYGPAIQGERFTLDNIRVIQNCLPATSSSAGSITTNSAALAVVGSTSGQWEINLIPTANATNTGVVTHTGSGASVPVTNLTPSTTYTYFVRSNCGLTQSTWIGPYSFTTLQSPAPMPFSDDFESNTVGWTIVNGSQLNKWFVGNATANSGTKSMYISNDNGVSNAYTVTSTSIVHAYRDIVIPTGTTNVGVSFSWKAVGDPNDYISVWAVPQTVTPVAGTATATGTNRIKIGTIFNNSAGYQTYSYMLNATAFAGQNMRLIFEWRNNALAGVQPAAAIDNVVVQPVTCPVPANITFTNITMTTATVNWQETGTSTSWEVVAVPTGSPFPGQNPAGVVTASQLTAGLINLNPSGSYDVYVRSICSPDKSIWSKASTALLTLCGTIPVPFTETFNSDSPSKRCWTVIDANNDNLKWNLSNTYLAYEGDQLASLTKNWNSTSNDDWLISPAIQLNGNQRVKFRYRVVSNMYTTEMEVRLSTTGNAIADFTNVLMPQQVINNQVYEQKIIYLNSYNGVAYIALHVPNVTTNSWTLWIDEFVIEDIPSCPSPTALTGSNYSNNTATLSWTPGYQETQWEVKVQPANSGVPTTDGVLVSSNTYNAPNLSTATLYEYYVRAYCSSTNKSEWVGPFVFNTTVCPAQDRCNYKFTITATTANGTFSKLNVYQNGILVGTINAGSGLTNSGTVAMCPGIPFTFNWDYNNWADYTAEVIVLDSYDEIVYQYIKGVSPVVMPITVPIYSGIGTCTPLACPKPQNVVTTANTSSSITIDWTEVGTATSWEVFAVPAGEPAPTASSVGTVVSAHPYTLSNLTPGRRYTFYVRSICSDTSKSTWTLPKTFYTQITNDNCDTAYVLPVSSLGYCTTPYSATLLGATASSQGNVCGNAAYANDDVWFEFTATATSHILYINNRDGSSTLTQNLSKVLYSGTCNNLTQVLCTQGNNVAYNTTFFITGTGANNNDVLMNNLVIGTTYKLRIFSNYATVNDTRFDICIATPNKALAIDQTTYTEEQLISDVLVNENCAQVSNLNYFTGTNYGAPHNGIGYFSANGADFPFQNGIILSTGKAGSATGPKTTIQSANYLQTVSPYATLWLGDQDLYDYVSASGTSPGLVNFYNATSIEFDFMAYGTEMSFEYLFASEDYGYMQCLYADAFAFFLTDSAGNTVNLATLPGTTLPVSIPTTRDSKFNYTVNGSNCTAGNPQFFDKLYDGYKGVSRYAAADNFMGHTKPLKVQAPVIPGETYRIKMVIAETNDGNFDSAIFLDANSFDVGRINFGADLLVSTNNAVCFGSQKVLDTKLNTTYFNFVWTKDDVVIDGATGATYTVTEPGTYKVVATVITSGCTTSDEIEIEFFDNIETLVNAPADLTLCSSTADAAFNLGLNTTAILENVTNASDYEVSYFETQALAEAGDAADAITDISAYTAVNDHVVYVRTENTVTGCYIIDSFKTIVVPNTIAVLDFSYPVDICTIAAQNPEPVKAAGFAEGGTYAAVNTDITVDAVTGIIDLAVTQPGTYAITYTLADANCITGGTYEATVTINATTSPAITFTYDDVCVLSSNGLPVLPAGFITGGTFTSSTLTVDAQTGEINLTGATVGTHNVDYSVNADAGACTGAETYTATIEVTAAQQPAISFTYADVCELAATAQPVLPTGFVTGGTYSSATLTVDPQTGTIDLTGTAVGIHNVEYVVNADVTTCSAADSFTASINITAPSQPLITFTYADACALGTTAQPVLPTGFVTGGTYSSATLTVDAQTGFIDPSTASTGQHNIVYQVSDDAVNCTAGATYTASILITDAIQPVTSFTYEAIAYCMGAGNVTPVLADGFATGGTFSANSTEIAIDPVDGSIDVSASQPGTYVITYEYVAQQDCEVDADSSFTITLEDGISTSIEDGCRGNALWLEAVPLNNSYDAYAANYEWKDENGTTVGNNSSLLNVAEYVAANPNVTLPVTFTVTVTSGQCVVTEEFEVFNVLCEVQRGISPNNDGMNDYLDLRGMDVTKLIIYNRYGHKVYELANYTNQWHGQSDSSDELPTGTYFYVLELKNSENKTGWIYINRQD